MIEKKKNFKITAKEDDKEYWISRAVAVTVCVRGSDKDGNYYYLISKRGKGCPDHVGKWQSTCGYLDWGETILQAGSRELYEEIGLMISEEDLYLISIIDDPKRDSRENIVFRCLYENLTYEELADFIVSGEINRDTLSRGGEDNEIDEIRLIKHSDIHNYEWAFDHDLLIEDMENLEIE